jgi:glyoxylase-like metal-dependent hydrolase (beta-lactamase superfamily II)
MDAHLPVLPRTEADRYGRLRPVAPGLWATPDEPLGGPANTCGFLLQRDDGNAFVYSCSAIEAHFDHLDELGGVAMVLLNHRDEATRHVTTLADHYGAPVHTHTAEVEPCRKRGVRTVAALDGDTRLGDDLHALHTPGHTPGVLSYAWSNPRDGKRHLFTGDTLTNFTIDRIEAVLGFHPYEGNADDLRRSLLRIRQQETDVLLPGLANGTINAHTWTTAQREHLIDAVLARLDADITR